MGDAEMGDAEEQAFIISNLIDNHEFDGLLAISVIDEVWINPVIEKAVKNKYSRCHL